MNETCYRFQSGGSMLFNSMIGIMAGLSMWVLANILYDRQPIWYLVLLILSFVVVANYA